MRSIRNVSDRYLTSSGDNISLKPDTHYPFERVVCIGLNADVLQRSGLPLISDILLHLRLSLFGHIARLDSSVPANAAFQLMVNSHEGKKPSTTWTRPSGRPRHTWLNHIQDADARPLSTMEI